MLLWREILLFHQKFVSNVHVQHHSFSDSVIVFFTNFVMLLLIGSMATVVRSFCDRFIVYGHLEWDTAREWDAFPSNTFIKHRLIVCSRIRCINDSYIIIYCCIFRPGTWFYCRCSCKQYLSNFEYNNEQGSWLLLSRE